MRRERILIVEDEFDLADPIREGLEDEGYECVHADNGTEAVRLLSQSWNLIILDLMLPGMSGESILKYLQQDPARPPVLIVTARSALDDKLTLFRMGCDDYLTKPFVFDELLMRARALLRRSQLVRADDFKYQDMELNVEIHQLQVGSARVSLTPKETAICRLLMSEPGRVVSRKEILNGVWGLKEEQESNFLGVHMFNLKKKLAQYGRETWLQTVRASGFSFSKPGMAQGT